MQTQPMTAMQIPATGGSPARLDTISQILRMPVFETGEVPAPLLRLRYKRLLKTRFQADPERFYRLLEQERQADSAAQIDGCLRETLRAFLGKVAQMPAYHRWRHRRRQPQLNLLMDHPTKTLVPA